MKFTEFKFGNELQEGLDMMGFEQATPIQEQAIPIIQTGRDLIACAQTGTGKTAAFALPILHRLQNAESKRRRVRVLVLVPTRELASQVGESFRDYGSNLRFRGPDYEFESYPHERLYFGQTVLSLTGEFNKPSGDYLKSKSKRYQLAFNGEIYNYRAIKDKYQKLLFNIPDSKLTDSEVLVNLFDTLNSKEIADEIDELYSSVIKAGTFKATSIKVAESAKVIENAQRDINIAFMNELAKIFSKMDIDTNDVLLTCFVPLQAKNPKTNINPPKADRGTECPGMDTG